VDYFKDLSYHTLNINDSTIAIDKYGFGYESSLINRQEFYEIIQEGIGPYQIRVENDTLRFSNSPYSNPFVRVDSVLTYRSDVFCDQMVEVDLPDMVNDNLISFPPRSLTSYVTIGNLKKGHQLAKSQIRPDSFLIHVNDMFIPFGELSSYLNNEKAKLHEFERSDLILCVLADKAVPQHLMDKLIQTVREYDPNLKLYRGYINWKNRSIYYGKLN